MGLFRLFITSLMPVLKVLLIIAVGLYLATEGVDLLGADARRHLNNLVFYVFFPALICCSLADTVTIKDLAAFKYHHLMYNWFGFWMDSRKSYKDSSTPSRPYHWLLLQQMREACFSSYFQHSVKKRVVPLDSQPAALYMERLTLHFLLRNSLGTVLKLIKNGSIPYKSMLATAIGLRGSGVGPSLIIGIIAIRNILMPETGILIVKVAKHWGLVNSDSFYQFTLMLQYAMPPAMNIGTISQVLGTGESEFSVIMLWNYIVAAFSITLWIAFYMWLVT
ncbi:Auxin efflux carrier [Corchorus olitorius]|uniref:Auxin efflux carrier n=1 Tax=Corchorus olitorius TaxID=93759 RepID=A0A1R3KY36_9ROSI|nr:Auxin efflux carrier [Corchorus olitorius]